MEDERKRSGMMTRDEWMAWLRETWAEAQARAHTIKTWQERCEEHPDHEGIVTERMIRNRMQEEIDELRQAIAEEEKREWAGLTDEEIDQAVKSCNTVDTYKYFRAIEAKLKEKNT